MEQAINKINELVEQLEKKANYYKENRFSEDLKEEEKWTKEDTHYLEILRDVATFLHNNSFNMSLDMMKQDNSYFDKYCKEKYQNLVDEIPKHKSKHILKGIYNELERLKNIIYNKKEFLEQSKKQTISYETFALNLDSKQSNAVLRQLTKVYLGQSNENEKIVLNDLLNGKDINYNKLGLISNNKKISREINELNEIIPDLNDDISNYLNNPLIEENKKSELFNKIAKNMSKFIPYKDYFKEVNVNLPERDSNIDYVNNCNYFINNLISSNVFEKIFDIIDKENEQLVASLPQEYKNVSYGTFGTNTEPGIYYYLDNTESLENIKRLSEIYKILEMAKKDTSLSINDEIIKETENNIENNVTNRIKGI